MLLISCRNPSTSTDWPALLGQLLGQLDREAVCRDEQERLVRCDPGLAGELVEDLQPARERLGEALLLCADDTLDLVRVLASSG